MEEQSIRSRAVPEPLPVDKDVLDKVYAWFRRRVVFVPRAEFPGAMKLIEKKKRVVEEHRYPVRYVTGGVVPQARTRAGPAGLT